MKKTISFGDYENITNSGMDGMELSFPFTLVDSDLIGAPEEKSSTQDYRVIVSISDSRLRGWGLSKDELPKVLFEYGRRFVEGHIREGTLPKQNTLRMRIITTASHPGGFEFDLLRLRNPSGYRTEIEVKRKIGFRP